MQQTEQIIMKGHHSSFDPRLDRVPEFDEKSRDYPISALPIPKGATAHSWPDYFHGDQGNEGACVGFGHSGCAATQPHPYQGINNDFAQNIYRQAQMVDEWPGQDYSGTSVLAGAKVMTRMGIYKEYRWVLSADDLLLAFHHGPVVFGVPWLQGMYTPRPSGLLEVDGAEVGGHCILGRGLLLNPKLKGEGKVGPCVRWRQSWGTWGENGDCFIKIDDLWDKLLSGNRGEGCVPIKNAAPTPGKQH